MKPHWFDYIFPSVVIVIAGIGIYRAHHRQLPVKPQPTCTCTSCSTHP